jgi:hypothetical protein
MVIGMNNTNYKEVIDQFKANINQPRFKLVSTLKEEEWTWVYPELEFKVPRQKVIFLQSRRKEKTQNMKKRVL